MFLLAPFIHVAGQPDSSNPKPANVRPPSPLRHSIVPNTFTGIDPDDNSSDDDSDSDDDLNGKMNKRNNNYPYQSSSPSSSVSQLAASLAQRVGNFVAGTRVPHLPTDAELEAEAKREREKSRREAERILTREAEERRKAEERIFGMKDMGESLPPPSSRIPQAISDPPSPSISPKSGGTWWTAAKSRLTPTKEKDPLTPAQQIILEAKAKEKERDKNPKGKEKESKEWPTHPEAKFNDPSLLNLNVPPAPPSRPIPASPVSPTPSRTQAPLLTPSPMRSISEGASSPSKETPPLYTQFTPQGTLDVHGTLLTIAKRFEKLEKWTVGHVRALEDRMNDVERWLVEKEKEKESQKESTPSKTEGQSATVPEPSHELGEIKEELAELQGRVIELGREMARMNSRHSPESPSSSLPSSHMGPAFTTPLHPRLPSTTARESTTPPMVSAKHTGTRLPYPAGDYASPPDNLFSPAHSPPSSVNSATRSRPVAIPTSNNNATGLEGGLPSSTSLSTSYSSTSFSSVSSISSRPLPASPRSHSASNSITRVASPTPVSSSQSQEPATLTLPPLPKLPSSSSGSPRGGGGGKRQTSVSPTPRKRYTVALGEPIVSREPQVQEPAPPPASAPLTRRTHSRTSSLASTASFMSMMSSAPDDGKSDKGEEDPNGDDDVMDDQFADETIGKSAGSKLTGVVNGSNGDGSSGNGGGGGATTTTTEPSSEKPNSPSPRTKRRIRPQSAHDFSSFLNSHQQQQVQVQRQQRTSQQSLQSQSSTQSSQSSTSVAPLRPRWRSHSTDRGDGAGAVSGGKDDGRTSRFIDPLVLRKQGRELGSKLPMPKPIGKVPVGQLVAFFDGDKKP